MKLYLLILCRYKQILIVMYLNSDSNNRNTYSLAIRLSIVIFVFLFVNYILILLCGVYNKLLIYQSDLFWQNMGVYEEYLRSLCHPFKDSVQVMLNILYFSL
jgi:hypothetical protein